jgi:glycosyltransferase involved in cell wall biosynthesis
MEKTIKVSVCVVTYNQVGYIEQCLLSLINQVTNFDFEVIVGDDQSTDGTSDVVRRVAKQYPHIVKAVVHERNVGITENYLHVHAMARGIYIAHLDGDDYALPGKLQAQSDFLDANPDYNIVWHRMLVENPKANAVAEDLIDLDKLHNAFTRLDLFRHITIGMNSSKMYRASVRDIVLPSFPLLDYFANVEQIGSGYAGFVSSQPLGVYRAGIGIASSGSKTKVLLVESFYYFMGKYQGSASDISVSVSFLFVAALKNRRFGECKLFLPVFIKSFRLSTIPKVWRARKMISMLRIPDAIKSK